MIMRGGSSKGAYFVAGDLPTDTAERDRLLMAVMGTPDPRQIDGMGGAHPLTSKVAIVGPSDRADVEYLFLQLGVDDAIVTDRQNCGNLLAGVGAFAVERGLVEVTDGDVNLDIHMLNTGALATATFQTSGGTPLYAGSTAISGVPGTAAPVRLDFQDIAGGSCGALLPTGNRVDTVRGVACTLIDNGMPVVVMRADALSVSGDEPCEQLEANAALRQHLEEIRLDAGQLMNLGAVSETTIPKLTMVSAPRSGGNLCTRTFIPHRCHDAIGVLGAVSVATAALLPGTPASDVAEGLGGGSVVLEHPTGTFEAVIDLAVSDNGFIVERAGIIRTARKLMDGVIFPRSY